jgi:hypothetical protein
MRHRYYTYRIRIVNAQHVQVEKRDDKGEILGEPAGKLGYRGELRQQIDLLCAAAHSNELVGTAVAQLGEYLFQALFDDTLRQDFLGLYNRVVHNEQKLLRIELDVDESSLPEVAALPWEFTRLPTSANMGALWLATAPNLIFSRRRAQWFAPRPIQLLPGEKLRIALAVSAPDGLGPVEYKTVWDDLQKLAQKLPEQIELLPLVAQATPQAVDDSLAQKPHIFHFIGHARLHDELGAAVGQIALVDDLFNEPVWCGAERFSELFNRFRPGVVLLHACEGAALSAAQAFVGVASRVVQQNIPVVVAMQHEVSNNTAVRFALRFYDRLARLEPVDQAAQEGRRSIALGPLGYTRRDFATPVIFMRVRDGHLFVHPEAKPEWREIKLAHPAEQTAVSLTQNARTISQIIANQFNLEEIDEICREMGFDPENLRGSTKNSRAQGLFEKSQRRSLLDQLVNAIAKRQRNLIGELKANLYLFIQNASPTQINEAALTEICEELQLDCQQLQLDANGLVGYTANNYIRAARTKALQDHMVENGRYPELVAAVKKRLPHTDLSIFEL